MSIKKDLEFSAELLSKFFSCNLEDIEKQICPHFGPSHSPLNFTRPSSRQAARVPLPAGRREVPPFCCYRWLPDSAG